MMERGEDEGIAKEDARYVMPLATSAQLGMTINARELEYMISRLAAHPLSEIRLLSSKLADAVIEHAPSLIKYPEPTDYFMNRPRVRGEIAQSVRPVRRGSAGGSATVSLVDMTPDGDRKLAAAILFSCLEVPMKKAQRAAARLSGPAIERLVARTMSDMKPHDSVWREFENIHMLFELTVSASCFAQLKRHRIATLIPQPYDPALGISIPASIRNARVVGALRNAIAVSERLYREIVAHDRAAAYYALTNAHRRRVLFGLNLRELYHFSRLRSDKHAQWEIREISMEMCRTAARAIPAGTLLLAGKDRFGEAKKHAL
jgi:thymidylate synthase ThyX